MTANYSEIDKLVAEMMAAIRIDEFDDPAMGDPYAEYTPQPGEREMAIANLSSASIKSEDVDWDAVESLYPNLVKGGLLTAKKALYEEGMGWATILFNESPESFIDMTAGQIQAATRSMFASMKLQSEHSYEYFTAGFVSELIHLCGADKE